MGVFILPTQETTVALWIQGKRQVWPLDIGTTRPMLTKWTRL